LLRWTHAKVELRAERFRLNSVSRRRYTLAHGNVIAASLVVFLRGVGAMLSVTSERPTSDACPTGRPRDIEVRDGGDTNAGWGLVRGTVLGLACWVVLGAIAWVVL
jgi:hypothetical protein